MKLTDISDKGRKQGKRLRYEVLMCHVEDDPTPELVAKFRSYGDAVNFATGITKGNVFYFGVLIRS
jgi:hypothetical protein